MNTTSSTSPPPTSALCRRIAAARTAKLDADTRRAARRAFVNWLGCAIAGADDPSVAPVVRMATELSGPPQATLVGSSSRVDLVNAALVNGTVANALDYDDMHVATLIHPTGPVVATAIALAEHMHASGDDLLRAIVVGIEVECRLGLVLFPTHYDAGWHSTSTLGTLGAAAAASVLLDLDPDRTAHALGIAATQASGLRAMLSNPCKSFNIGQAASRGMAAALLARGGLESSPDVLEARYGLLHVFGVPAGELEALSAFGHPYIVSAISLKPYPCGVVIHPLIDAALTIAADLHVDDPVVEVTARVHPRAIDLAGTQHPDTAITGRFSLYHAAALALVRRSASLDAFDRVDVRDAEIARVRGSMRVIGDATLQPSQSRLAVITTGGRRFDAVVDDPSGSPQRPLTDAQLHSKFMELAMRKLDAEAAEALYRTAATFDTLADCATLPNLWAGRCGAGGSP